MLNSLLALICTCHVLGLRLFCVSAAPGPPQEEIGWNLKLNYDETSMVQAFVHSHKAVIGQEPVYGNDQGPPMQMFGNVPVYGYERAHHNNLVDTWMLMFPESYTSQMLWQICSKFGAPGICTYVGHPEEGGLAHISIKSSENELRNSISSSCAVQQNLTVASLCSARYAELDAPVKMYDPVGAPSERKELSWGLDRIDSRKSKLDGKYKVDFTGAGVDVFLFDSGINCELDDFSGRAIPLLEIKEEKIKECKADQYDCALDNNGHGTHTAGTIASLTYGVATGATIYAVKVLDDFGYGSWTGLVDAMDWVITYAAKKKMKRAIISASLGGIGPTAIVSEAIRQATDAGISIVVAAGNSDTDACGELPASVKAAITVGSVDFIDDIDIISSFSNYGRCIDIFAPGSNITSLSHKKGEAPLMMSGTSMACPHVAGVVALLFEEDPKLTGKTVAKTLKGLSTRGCIKNLFPIGSTPNKLLYFGTDADQRPCQRNKNDDKDD